MGLYMNKKQMIWSKMICNIVCIPNIEKYGDDYMYMVRNSIAKYSLANDEYYITDNALEQLNNYNNKKHIIKSLKENSVLRGWKKQLEVKYEHTIPSKIVLNEIIKYKNDTDKILQILEISDCVTITTIEENNKLNKKYKSDMPSNWNFNDDIFARYKALNIKVSNKKIKMNGALYR